MKLANKKASALLAAVFATALAGAAAAEDTGFVNCGQDLTELDGGKTTVSVIKKDDGLYRVDVTTRGNMMGLPTPETTTTLIDNAKCDRTLAVANQETGEVRLESLYCETRFNGQRKKSDLSVYFNKDHNNYQVNERVLTLPPSPPGGIEIGMIPQSIYKDLGLGRGFACMAVLPR